MLLKVPTTNKGHGTLNRAYQLYCSVVHAFDSPKSTKLWMKVEWTKFLVITPLT